MRMPLVVLVLVLAIPAWGSERLVREIDHRHGLAAGHVSALAQDDAGFLWIGTSAGLTRYDGTHLVRVPGTLPVLLLTSLQGRTFAVVGHERRLFEASVRGLSGPVACGATPCEGITDLSNDGATLHVAASGELWSGAPSALRQSTPTALQLQRDEEGVAERIRFAQPSAGWLWLGTDRGVWQVDGKGAASKLASVERLTVVLGGDPAWAGTFDGRVIELRGGVPIERYRHPTDRVTAIVRRGETLWVAFSNSLAAFRPGQDVELLGPDQIPSGGPLLVDHEGSLWLGTYRGLRQYPEPETYALNTADGLPSAHARFVTRERGATWLSTWGGSGRVSSRGGRSIFEGVEPRGLNGRICLDRDGRAWAGNWAEVLQEAHGEFERAAQHDGDVYVTCAPSADGSVWLGYTPHLYRVRTGRPVEPMGRLPQGEGRAAYTDALYEDASGTLWVGLGERVCHVRVGELESRGDAWRCTEARGGYHAADFLEVDGELLLATKQGGLFRRRGDTFERHPGSSALASGDLLGLSPSPRGGFWIAGAGILQRVRSRGDRLEVLEMPGGWQGLMTGSASDVHEDEDGTLFIATQVGLVVMPAIARDARPDAPRVELIDARGSTDGEGGGAPGRLALAHGRNWLELSFAALSFRDPSSLRYRVRQGPGEEWTELRGPTFRFADLAAGEHVAEVAASLDGERWTPSGAALAFEVRRPWYASPWPWLAVAGCLALIAWSVQRARWAMRLRVEQLRSHMAMDLHDELGSGLGSIGILAALAGDEALSAEERRRIAAKIADTAGELGVSLSDIVWSLRPSSASLEALAAYVTERASRLFPGDGPTLELQLPDPVPRVPLSLATCRAVQLVALEALHNARKHGDAGRVVLSLAPEGRRWRLTVEDDGRGHPGVETAGLGMKSMRQRAAEIGAHFDYKTAVGAGTKVSIRFAPRAEDELKRRELRGVITASATPNPGGGG